ncbi:MAG: CehA/McbA family metallohydrolase [Chloroflexi bacterium]|nr:CehA/McbA family metallohydrolase [Chloroflexota bacterium]
MTTGRRGSATRLAHPVDLSSEWNASDREVGARFHPLYGRALKRLPDGASVFRGLPFDLGTRAAGRRWVLVRDELTIDLRGHGLASHLVVAHFADSWRDARGERSPGTPVGWVLPTGQPLARYEITFADGDTRVVDVRRRFEIADGIIGWGFLPFAAIGHRSDETINWRGPHPRQSPGRYAPAGHAGALTMLPGSWGAAQTGVADFVPTARDDATYWLHAIPLGANAEPVRLRLVPLGDGRAGTDVVIAALTLFRGTADPLVLAPRRQLLITGPARGLPDVDLGMAIQSRPLREPPASTRAEGPIGWGHPNAARRGGPTPADTGTRSVLDLTVAPDARISFIGWAVGVADLDTEAVSPDGRITIQPLPGAAVRVDVRLSVDDEATPARVRFVASDGRYLPPLGHREEINPGICEDSGAGLILGRDTYAYVPGTFQIDLPIGGVTVEVVKGFDHRPVRKSVVVGPDTRDLVIALDRPIDLRAAGWRSSDSHVHFLAPSTALLQAAAEDLTFVHVLATQLGDEFTSIPDLPWGSQKDPSGRHMVFVGTENRQNMLGHLALLGARHPVVPLAAGGAPEGRIGGAITELLSDWADRCHAEGGLVVGAHFPLPFAEIAAGIVAGRIDAIEMQCFAPGLDNPSILEWYRFLNCGYRVPVLGGTDKMSAEVPVGAVRTYARLDPDEPPTFEAWSAAVRAGRTFATSGPVIELSVDGHEPGDVLSLPASGGHLEAHVRARAAQPIIGSVELIVNGRVVARRDAPQATDDVRLETVIEIDGGAWVAARSRSDHEIHSAFNTSMASHTSPVYVEVLDRPLFARGDAEAILQVINGTVRWLETMAVVGDPALRARMAARIAASGATLRARIGPATWEHA